MDADTPDPTTLTRNWNELLQELRVAQTGTQILTGFLLTVPFSARFEDLDDLQRYSFLAVLSGSVLTTMFVIAPVAFHRWLFRQRQRLWIVEAANVCARIGLALLAVTVSGVLFLVLDIVVGTAAGLLGLAVSLGCFGLLWGVVPLVWTRESRRAD
jgi:hypothetical protein